jgi:hypothetical protein
VESGDSLRGRDVRLDGRSSLPRTQGGGADPLTWVAEESLRTPRPRGTNDDQEGVALTMSAYRNSRPSTNSNWPVIRVF